MSKHDPGSDDPTFLSRWMRRKEQQQSSGLDTPSSFEQSRAARHQIDSPVEAPVDSLTNVPAVSEGAESAASEMDGVDQSDDVQSGKPVLVDSDMPPLESLNEASDFGQFMSPGVSDVLRKAALRKLFRLPVFGLRDGLDDYDEDFRSFAALGNIITADMRFEKQRFEERMREQIEKRRLAGEEIDEDTEEQLVSEAGRAAMPDDAEVLEPDSRNAERIANGHDDEDEDDDEDGETDEEALG